MPTSPVKLDADAPEQHLRSDFRLWGLHMKGLKTLIELRGGVDSLASNQLLRILLFL